MRQMKYVWLVVFLMSCASDNRTTDPSNQTDPGNEDIDQIEQPLPGEGECVSTCDYTCPPSPIMLDLAGNGFSLTDPEEDGVTFDLSPGGDPENASWTEAGSDDSFLVLDRDENGTINDGTELFGNFTNQPDSELKNGYSALKLFDTDDDNIITASDAVFTQLRLWTDTNHNGVSESSELTTLSSHGITGIGLDFKAVRRYDEHGNLFRYMATVYKNQGSTVGHLSYDVFLALGPAPAGKLPSCTQCNTTSCTLLGTTYRLYSYVEEGSCGGHNKVCVACAYYGDNCSDGWVPCSLACWGGDPAPYCTIKQKSFNLNNGGSCQTVYEDKCPSPYISGTTTIKCDSRLY